MPNVAVFDMAGNKQGEMELKAEVFGAEINKPVLHSVVRAYLLNQRQGTQSTKTRSEVSAAVSCLGDRRAQVVQDRVQPVHLSGHTAAWHSVRSPVPGG